MNDIINKLRNCAGMPTINSKAVLTWIYNTPDEAIDLIKQLQDENANLKRQLDCLKDNKESEMNEWKELKTLQDVAAAQAAGEEIECTGNGERWVPWTGEYWHTSWKYRSRPAKPKTKKVKLQAWFNGSNLIWKAELVGTTPFNWVRVPSEDKEIEVPE